METKARKQKEKLRVHIVIIKRTEKKTTGKPGLSLCAQAGWRMGIWKNRRHSAKGDKSENCQAAEF